jgi:hypothetical protein
VVPPAFVTRWRDLGVRCNGRSRPSYDIGVKHLPMLFTKSGDFVFPISLRGRWVKGISLPARLSRIHRQLSERLGNYLSSRCLIGRDYTIMGRGVKLAEWHRGEFCFPNTQINLSESKIFSCAIRGGDNDLNLMYHVCTFVWNPTTNIIIK